VIDNVVWTDSWPSIAGAGCGLICIGVGEEWARKVYALLGIPRSGETNRPVSKNPVASGVKCGSHGGKKSKTKSWIRVVAG
jgi:hypothetical protein